MAREVTFDGKTWPSVAACARANGIPDTTLRDYLGLRAEIGPRPVTIRGISYPSLKAAGDAIGVSREAVRQAANRGTLDSVGMKKTGGGA